MTAEECSKLIDLIDAETEAQRKQAQAVLAGELGLLAERWRRDLIRAASLLEAVIDFADEDVPTDVTPEVRSLVSGVMADLEREAILGAIRTLNGDKLQAAKLLGIGKTTLYRKLKEYGIS